MEPKKIAINNHSAELHVIWFDLENAYGSVTHLLLEKAMDFFWIAEDIKNLILTYLNVHMWGFLMINI